MLRVSRWAQAGQARSEVTDQLTGQAPWAHLKLDLGPDRFIDEAQRWDHVLRNRKDLLLVVLAVEKFVLEQLGALGADAIAPRGKLGAADGERHARSGLQRSEVPRADLRIGPEVLHV